jgi:sulfur relay (sulfurtransferase) DsrC/TusE family protein
MAAGVEIKMVSQRLGHSQISTTADLYTHVSKGFSRAAAEQIAGIPKPSSGAVPTAFLQQTHRNQSSERG